MTRWLRRVIAPDRLAEMLLAGWFPAMLFAVIHVANADTWPGQDQLRSALPGLLAMAVLWGGFRVWQAHPACRPGYADWLSRTPWSPRQPLPDGPVHLVPQDAVVVALLAGPAVVVFGPGPAGAVVQTFAVLYLVTLGVATLVVGPRSFGYLVLAGVGGVALQTDPLAVGVASAAVYVIALGGLRRSLDAFPWDITLSNTERVAKATANRMGWPHGRLGPAPPPARLARWEAAAIAGVVGWWVFVVAYQMRIFGRRVNDPDVGSGFVGMVLGYGTFFLILGRLVKYMSGHAAPITRLGALRLGRPVLRKYDVVYVAPLLAMAAGVGVAVATIRSEVPVAVAGGVGAMAVVWIVLGVGPSRAWWQLASRSRLVPTAVDKLTT